MDEATGRNPTSIFKCKLYGNLTYEPDHLPLNISRMVFNKALDGDRLTGASISKPPNQGDPFLYSVESCNAQSEGDFDNTVPQDLWIIVGTIQLP
jgi:hypothetical protein